MTAVDHAELKRLRDELRAFEGSDDLGNGDFSVCEFAADGLDALLSEIEGLKAERDRLKLAICGGEDVPGAINAVSVEDCERFIAEERSRNDWCAEKEEELDALRTQAPDSWRPDSEAVFAAIKRAMTFANFCVEAGELTPEGAENPCDLWEALACALRPQTAESGK